MKFTLTTTLLFTIIYSTAQVLSNYPTIPYTEFLSVDIIDDNIIARGDCDQLWSSVDGGTSWSYKEVIDLESANLSLIPDHPNKALFLVNDQIAIYDLPNKEIEQPFDGSSFGIGFGSIVMTQGEDLYLLTRKGLFTTSLSDWEWEMVFESTEESGNFGAGDITDNFVYIGTHNGQTYRYNINDQTTELRSNYTDRISEISMGTDEIGYVIISGVNRVQKTIDGGINYESMDKLNITRNVHALGENIVATILGYSLSVSMDGGLTVENYNMSNTENFGDIDNGFIDGNGTIYAYGKGSTIAHSSDFGESFQFIHPYNRSDFRDVSIYSDGYGIACGEHSTTIESFDHGETWSLVDFGIPPDELLSSIDRLNNGNIIISSQNGIYLSENNQVIHNEVVKCNDILVTNAGNLLAFTNNDGKYQALRSIDSGLSWTVVLDSLTFTEHLEQAPTGEIYIARQDQEAYISNDDGTTWTTKKYGIIFQQLFPYNEQIIMGIENGNLSRSEDGGNTWNIIRTSYLLNNLIYISESEFYLTHAQNGETHLIHTRDSGKTWDEVYLNCTVTLAAVRNNAGEIIMAQSTGHINKYIPTISTPTTDVVTNKSDHLLIWPNPINRNDFLHIGSEWSTLKVLDLRGKTIFESNLYESNIQLPIIKSGMYLIQANCQGIIKTEKIIIM